MVVYYKHGVNLSEGQMSKISTACKKKEAISIRLSNKDLHGSFELPLTRSQINRIKKTAEAGDGAQLNLSAAQLKYRGKTGGFLPLLLAALPAILGGVGGLTGGIASAVSAAKSNTEQRRHNEATESQLKSGNGIISDVV